MGGANPFDPRHIPGLALWLSGAKSPHTIVTGVSQWNDISGNGNHATQATADNQPAFSASAIGGQPGLVFDGINDVLDAGTAPRPSADFTVWAVGVCDDLASSGDDTFIGWQNSSNTTGARLRRVPSTTRFGLVFGDNSTFHIVEGGAAVDGVPVVLVGTYDGTGRLYVNGASVGVPQTQSYVEGTNGVGVGSRAGAFVGTPLTGKVADTGIIHRAVTDAELAALHQYLSTRYGIALA